MYKAMKKLLLSTLAIGLLIFTACEDSVGPTVQTDGDVPVVTSHSGGESYVLTEDQADEELFTLSWDAPNFGFPAAITYYIEMDVAGTDFEEPVRLVETNQTSVSLTVTQVNSQLISAGIPAGIEAEIPMRIRAHINDSVPDRISETFVLGLTPYDVSIEFDEIYVPGGYQAASGYTNDWSPADAPPLTSEGNDQYEGYVYFANDGSEFKFTDERSWDLNWGDDGADGTLQQNGENIDMENAGYYKINVNLNNLTYEYLRTEWGLIGDATAGGWDADQDMEYDPEDKVWRITSDLTAGEMKFRANDDWELDYGDNMGDGTLEEGGDNIPVDEAGNYTVELNLGEFPYSYTVTRN
ncbi:hypothetical protein BH23BAC3_BH23BAC3_31730 [soil metagenome]